MLVELIVIPKATHELHALATKLQWICHELWFTYRVEEGRRDNGGSRSKVGINFSWL